MKTSESIKEIAPALVKAQQAIATIKKDKTGKIVTKTGGSYEYHYSDLASVIEAVKAPLNDNGIAFIQCPSTDEKGVTVSTTFLHSSSEWIAETIFLPVGQNATPQQYGSAITYGKRYLLQSMTGLPSEDDDGKAASEQPAKRDGGARQTAVDALAGFGEEQRLFLSNEANKIMEASRTMQDIDLAAFVKAQTYDNEEKLALWALLPAPVRGKIKDGERKGSVMDMAKKLDLASQA